MKKNILITICARSGSVSVKDKNIKKINDLPLIAYSIKLAQKLKESIGADVILSTDSLEYKKVAEDFGLSTDYLRSPELASAQAGKIDVFKDALSYEEKRLNKRYEFLLDLEVTSPLRNTDDIIQALELLEKDKDALVIYGASLSTKNPYYNLVEQNPEGYYSLCIPAKEEILTRQTAPKVYESNGMLYIFRREFFDSEYKMFFTDRTLIYPSRHICFDIDDPIDFEMMDFFISNNKLDFELDYL